MQNAPFNVQICTFCRIYTALSIRDGGCNQAGVRIFLFKTQIRKIGVDLNGKMQNLIGGASGQNWALIGLKYQLALCGFRAVKNPNVVYLLRTMNFILKPQLHNDEVFNLHRKVLKETMLEVVTSNNDEALGSSDILQTLCVESVAKQEISSFLIH
jgi:hypothetical protein